MREAINDNELEMVAGGAVCFSKAKKRVSFSTLGVGYTIKGDYDEARMVSITLFAQNPDLNEKEFDILVRDTLQSKGLI